MKRRAQCCCGDVTIEVLDEPRQYGMCHCNNCKQRTGSAFGLSSYFKENDVRFISGQPSCYPLVNPHDNADQKRYFCGKCGSTVYWYVSTLPDLIGVAGGCFTEKPLEKPTYSVAHENKYSWVMVPYSVKKKP